MGTRKLTIEVPQKDETLHMVLLGRILVAIKKAKQEYGRIEGVILSGEFTEEEIMDLAEMGIELKSRLKEKENCYKCELRI